FRDNEGNLLEAAWSIWDPADELKDDLDGYKPTSVTNALKVIHGKSGGNSNKMEATELMSVTIVDMPEMNAVVLRTEQNGRDVRQAWHEVMKLMADHPARTDDEHGIVFVPEWQWATGGHILRVGVQVDSFDNVPEGLETMTIPPRQFA